MCDFLSKGTVTARKQHGCSWCGQKIEAGQRYVRQAMIFEGEMCANKFHPECDEACTEEARHEGGCFAFMPGENERPPPPNNQESP